MAEYRAVSKIVTKFLVDTCQPDRHHRLTADAMEAIYTCSMPMVINYEAGHELISLITGSSAELYITPMYSCVGDADIMRHDNTMLVIPAGYPLPAQLPDEFHSRVRVAEIIDSDFPGYVYLVWSYILTECSDEDRYNAVQCQRQFVSRPLHKGDGSVHGPAYVHIQSLETPIPSVARAAGLQYFRDDVYCMRCLSWPTQAANWTTRGKNYGWPDSATVDRIVSKGCDVVPVAHRLCRQNKWQNDHQWRLSFSRAEIVLLNSWTPVQQIVYHMLRIFMKTGRPICITDVPDSETIISNYNVKTLMLWACQLKPRSWWIDDLNVVRICIELLHTLAVWLTDSRCPHYFINNCNLFDHHDHNSHSVQMTVRWLLSITEPHLAAWFVNNYIWRCSRFTQLCDYSVLRMFDDVRTSTQLHSAVTAVVQWRLKLSLVSSMASFRGAQNYIVAAVHTYGLSLQSCLCWMRELANIDQRLCGFFTAVAFLHVGCKTTRDSLNDELLDVLATICLQSNDARRCLNARHSSVLSLSQAAKLMKVVANSSRSTVRLIEIEVSKAYLCRALRIRCKDSGNDSVYCLANVYLAVLYYTTEQYQMAIDHCKLVTRSHHSLCSAYVVQGELLPKIDDDIDSVLGLAVFYQHVRTTALNQQKKHDSVFTADLFANFLHMRCLSVTECHQFRETSSTDVNLQYRKFISEETQVFATDVLLFHMINRANSAGNGVALTFANRRENPVVSCHLDTRELLGLLQRSAVEHLTTFRQLEARDCGPQYGITTTDFESLHAYKLGDYQRCLEMCAHNVRMLALGKAISSVFAYPELIQLMDDNLASLTGLTLLVQPSCREEGDVHVGISQLSLSLYLMTQCQMKLHHSVTSLARTLDYIEVACMQPTYADTLDQLVLKLIERKILKLI